MDSEVSKVEVTDINMPFLSMVWFMVKWAIASIPAIIILWMLFMMFGGVLTGLMHIQKVKFSIGQYGNYYISHLDWIHLPPFSFKRVGWGLKSEDFGVYLKYKFCTLECKLFTLWVDILILISYN